MHKELLESRRTQSSSDRTKKIKLIFANLFKEGLQVIISNHFKSLRFGVDEKVVESKRIPFIRVGYNLNWNRVEEVREPQRILEKSIFQDQNSSHFDVVFAYMLPNFFCHVTTEIPLCFYSFKQGIITQILASILPVSELNNPDH